MAGWIGCQLPLRQFKDCIMLIVETKFPLDFLKNTLAVIRDRHFRRDGGFVNSHKDLRSSRVLDRVVHDLGKPMLPDREHVLWEVTKHRTDIAAPDAILLQRIFERIEFRQLGERTQPVATLACRTAYPQGFLFPKRLNMAMYALARYAKGLHRKRDDIDRMFFDMFQDKLPYLCPSFFCASHSESSCLTTLFSNNSVYCQHLM